MGKTKQVKSEKFKVKSFLLRFWPILAIFILVAAFAYPYWVKGLVPFPADYLVDAFPPWQYYYGLPVKNNAMPDVLGQMYPWKHLVIDLWKNRQLPLWNPYNFSGNPLLGNYQSAVFHPSNPLFFILPEVDAWSLMIILQPFLAGLFTYLFCRQLNLSKVAALLSSVAFMFCGFITCWMAYGTLSYAFLWLPLVLYALEKNFAKISPFSLVLISFSLAASFFSGHFQTTLYVLLGTFSFLIFKLIITRKVKVFVACSLFIFLGISLTAIQILPTFELHQLSVRSQAIGISEIVPWRYSVTLLAPDFYGNAVTRNDWFGHYAEWSGFTGVIPLILAIYALFKKKKQSVLLFALLVIISLLLSRPTPLLDLIVKWRIPVLSSSAAARVNGLLSFSIAILAGFGLDKLRGDLDKKKLKPALLSSLAVLMVILGIWGVLVVRKPFEVDKLLIAKRNLILPTGMAIAFFGLVLGYWLVQRTFKSKKLITHYSLLITLSAILLLTTFDLFRFASKWMPFDQRKHVYPDVPILTFLTQTVKADRVFGFFGMEMQNYYRIQGFNGYDPLYIQRYGELLMAARNGQIQLPSTRGVGLERRADYTERLMNLLGGRYFLHALEDKRNCWEFNFWDYPDQFEKIYGDEKYEVYENKGALPRAFLVRNFEIIKEDQAIVDRLFSEDFDLSKTIILEEEKTPRTVSDVTSDTSEVDVSITEYSPNRVNLEVETEHPGLLFLSDNYYPGWKAFVDDQEEKIYRANYTFRAVMVPEGKHRVIFEYQPQSFRYGLIISVFSLLGVVLLVVRFRSFGITRHSERSEESPS